MVHLFLRFGFIAAVFITVQQPLWAARPHGHSFLEVPKINFKIQNIHDLQLDNELAVTVALPDGWQIKNPDIVRWAPMVYSDPARIVLELAGPTDQLEFSMISKISFHYDYGIEKLAQHLYQQELQTYQQTLQMSQQLGMHPQQYGIKPPSIEKYQIKEGMLDGGGILRKSMSAENFVYFLIQEEKSFTDVKIKKVEKPPQIVAELTKALPQLQQQANEVMRTMGITVSVQADTALVEFSYTKNGQRYDAALCATITYSILPSAFNQTTEANDKMIYWTVSPIFGISALEGKLETHQMAFATILGNTKVHPIWKAKVEYLANETTRKINEARMKSDKEKWDAALKTQKEIAQIHRGVFERKADSLSNVSRGWTDAITGTSRWQGSGGKYAVPVEYNHVWEGPNGAFGTNDPNYNPNNDPNRSGSYKQLKQVPW